LRRARGACFDIGDLDVNGGNCGISARLDARAIAARLTTD
jgi:hypothetical protein